MDCEKAAAVNSKTRIAIDSLGVIVRALKVVAAEGDTTANEVAEDRAPLSIYFSFHNAVDFSLAFALKY